MKYVYMLIGVLCLFGLMIRTGRGLPEVQPDQTDDLQPQAYLPAIFMQQPTPTPIPIGDIQVTNNSFEEGWTDLPPASGNLINQQPNGWVLKWVEPGDLLYDSTEDISGGVPECIHKHVTQLPPDEQPGGENALVLDGEYVFKIFHFGAPFGAELTQEINNLPPGSTWRIIVPIQVHLHGETDPYAAESSVWINGEGKWVNGFTMGDRKWYNHDVEFVVPANGNIEITIRVKSKWFNAKDFFIDYLRLEQTS